METSTLKQKILNHPAIRIPDVPIFVRRRENLPACEVTCPICHETRIKPINEVMSNFQRNPNWSGHCKQHALRMGGRPCSTVIDFSHPAVHVENPPRKEWIYGHLRQVADVTCPKCGVTKVNLLSQVRSRLHLKKTFTGCCIDCVAHLKNGEMFSRPTGKVVRSKDSNGYINITRLAVSPEDMPLFTAMVRKMGTCAEHRFVMAKMLGRPLCRHECVDHMDGNRANNDPSNLRLYVTGMNHQGSGPMHGTFYHEWQTAEAKIRALQIRIAELEK